MLTSRAVHFLRDKRTSIDVLPAHLFIKLSVRSFCPVRRTTKRMQLFKIVAKSRFAGLRRNACQDALRPVVQNNRKVALDKAVLIFAKCTANLPLDAERGNKTVKNYLSAFSAASAVKFF